MSKREVEEILTEEFNSVLAWGMGYGPSLTGEGCHKMRDEMAAQFTKNVIKQIKGDK